MYPKSMRARFTIPCGAWLAGIKGVDPPHHMEQPGTRAFGHGGLAARRACASKCHSLYSTYWEPTAVLLQATSLDTGNI